MSNANAPKLIFRADGGAKIGLGHIMRCLAIAEMTGDLFSLSFAIQQPSDAVRHILAQAAFDLISLPETADSAADARNLRAHLTGDEFVLLDGYSFGADYQKTIKRHCRKLIVVDDLVAWHQYADVVINHGGTIQAAAYQSESYTQFLTGTAYALLRKPFLEAGIHRSEEALTTFQPRRVLVNLGGADPDNISHRVVEALLSEPLVQQIVIVLGAANPHGDSFARYAEERVQIRRNLSPEQIVTVIQSCDVAVVSCSTISYEVATVGKPFVGILTADNQAILRTFYKDNHIALGVLEKAFTNSELWSTMSLPVSTVNNSLARQYQFFDGRSGERIAAFFRTLLPA
ncbi:UDP-2,4-diacetamido-2,4,6-trideoxy-beta-L-altropyranose hydrolase [Spirosoma fluviale]|uniref:UDP-2,4-diacetamido-2,4,6-trideoxy-beta-L-altropyranose hydrolase n=1 Tax=Spirosoma fluviale TaxID=1597977 RepID=A0A286G9V6_9BACT|nr:UDP-2,4-diacetamido-2,4,6-trideoxy-beta-L-altropyranose hydrolase [Spirosoma fluviale]SOD92317.1 UDP-2,4-diacetamido-2,4,6-trideoxy-beta-L-altropyranose hydrolase [Spirosoma fluviale]